MIVQVDLPEEISIELKCYKIRNKIVTQAAAIIKILREKFGGEDGEGN